MNQHQTQTMQTQSTPVLAETSARVKNFLEDKFGYAKVRRFLAAPKNGLHLEGTIMGTYSKGQDYGEAHKELSWRRKYPHVSKIHPSTQLDEIAKQERRWYLKDQTRIRRGRADYRRLDRLQEEIKQRRFFIAYGLSLLKNTSAQVKELAEKIQEDFPESTIDYSLQDGFSIFLANPGFCFYSSGNRAKTSNKVVAVSFNLNPDAVEGINELVGRYHAVMHEITSK